MEMSGQFRAALTLPPPPNERVPVITEQEVGWVPEAVWMFWKTEKSPAPVGIRKRDRPARSQVTVATKLS
jgi:hypothetical protein